MRSWRVISIDKETRKAYDALFEILYKDCNETHAAYDCLLEYLVSDSFAPIILDFDDQLDWLFHNDDLLKELDQAYRPELIKAGSYDYLGDLYLENVISKKDAAKRGLTLTPQSLVDLMCAMTIGSTNQKVNILDPCVGTGRMLLTAKKYAPNARLFGVDNNITMIRTAFTNAAIQKACVYLLHADSLYHETDPSTEEGRYNWAHANRWQPQIQNLRPMRRCT